MLFNNVGESGLNVLKVSETVINVLFTPPIIFSQEYHLPCRIKAGIDQQRSGITVRNSENNGVKVGLKPDGIINL